MNSTTTAPGGTQQPPPQVASFFEAIRSSGFVRPDERMVAGVGSAVANRWRIDPILVRVAFVVLCLFGGLGLMAYGAGWLLIPGQDGRIHAEEAMAGRFAPGAVGGLVALLLGIFSLGPVWAVGNGPSVGGLIALAALVLVILVLLYAFGVIGNSADRVSGGPGTPDNPSGGRVDLTKGGGSTTTGSATWQTAAPPTTSPLPAASMPPPASARVVEPPRPPEPPKPSTSRRRGPGTAGTTLAAGLALLVAGAVVASREVLPSGVDVSAVAWASTLGLLALALVVGGLAGRRSGGIGWLAVIAAVVAVAQSLGGTGDRFYAGDVTWTPTALADRGEYQLSTGRAVLDLTDVRVGASAQTLPELDADVSVGELRVLVPDDLTVELDTAVGIGGLQGAPDGASRVGGAGQPDLVLHLNVGIGSMTIEEVSR